MTFEMFSIYHYLFIASPFVLLIIFKLLFKNKSVKFKRVLGFSLSLLAIILLILRNIEIYFDRGFDAELIPLQICHFANFVLLFAFMFNNKTLFALSFLLNLPAAFSSIIFANSLTNYDTILNFRGLAYIAGHSLIVFITLWAFLEGFIKINLKTFLKTCLTVFILLIVAHIVNNALMYFDLTPNYFYSIRPENGTPLETFYNMGTTYTFNKFEINPIYLALNTLLGYIVLLIFYIVYFMLMPLTKTQEKTNKIKSKKVSKRHLTYIYENWD